ncbi:hypothetical protein LOC68_17240 [Blastopirellula sp. JC732]|uniref:DUF1559 domain-containing protein n=1 Tax=Blastopirellula sediminis TaxID=2894196 RepID=A0A9X1MNQ2_9BACT|nr:hypothetical protein [Blastopirellula sediminis]MCC9606561.1 hypothetical protein [Blastopirellula sediminis]MCC9630141.1 hypothetical protein [Blastopirellula sediminis]
MRDNLLGYLLNALDEDEARDVEVQAERTPEIQNELLRLRSHVTLLEDSWVDIAPPAGLAARACAFLDAPIGRQSSSSPEAADALVDEKPVPRRSRAFAAMTSDSSRFTMADLLVAAGACVAAAVIFFPALASSRMLASRLQCENNLHQVGMALHDFAYQNKQQAYPAIDADGPANFAGSFGLPLVEQGYLKSPEYLSCAANRGKADKFRLPTLKEVAQAAPDQIPGLHANFDLVYNYNLGTQKNGRVIPPKMQGRTDYPVVSDIVRVGDKGNLNANGHGVTGVNVLFDDGRVDFIRLDEIPELVRQYYFNDLGKVEAGVNENDPVLGSGFTKALSGR